MAANYSQYTDHNEIGGVSVGLEDAKLAAADSVDEVASTDCVLMKDASGNPVKILKEDFNEAVRDALGSILSYNGLGTAIGKVAALGSSDNDLGSISTSDLASVLGVDNAAQNFKFQNVPSGITSFNQYPDGTCYFAYAGSYSDGPESTGWYFVVTHGNINNDGCQIAYRIDVLQVFYRISISGSKTGWRSINFASL